MVETVQKAEDDLKNSDLFRECKLCHEFMEISKFDVKYRNYTSIGPLDYHYWECKECRRNKTIKCIQCMVTKPEDKFKEFNGEYGRFRAKSCNECYLKTKKVAKKLF